MSSAFVTGTASLILLLAGPGAAIAQGGLTRPVFTPAQAKRGSTAYEKNCIQCHGDTLDNGEFAPPLRGQAFLQHFVGDSLDVPFSFMLTQMPPSNPGGLDHKAYAEILAYILDKNGVSPGNSELPDEDAKLKAMAMP